MQLITLPLAIALATCLPADDQPVSLATPYTAGLGLELSATLHFESEVVAFSMTRDGVEQDMTDRMGGPTQLDRQLVIQDRYTEVEEGRPVATERSFETLSSESERSRRGELISDESSGPLEGVTLELSLDDDDGDVVVEVAEGSRVDDDALLEGHRLTLGVDALLPPGPVEADSSWTVEADALLAATGLDLEAQLFPRPEAPERSGERGGPGSRGGGRGPGAGRGMGDMFRGADWDVEATLAEQHEELEGTDCYVIELEGEGSYELPEREFGGGRPGGRALAPASALLVEGAAGLDLEGKLYVASETKLPVRLELEVSISTEETTERSGDFGELSMHTVTEGLWTLAVELAKLEEKQ